MDGYAAEHLMNGYALDIDGAYEDEVEEEPYDETGLVAGSAGVGVGMHGGNEKGGAADLSSAGKIFVGGVAWETSEETFANHFAKYGAIIDSVIMKDKHTGAPRGFGFVTFSDPSVISNVLEDEHVIDGRTVEVKRTVPREEMSTKDGPRTRKIFIGGLPASLTEEDLRDHFSAYGKVVEHQIMLDHSTGRSRGFGFVTFESEEAVEQVISEGRMHDLCGKQVEVKKAEPKRSGGDSYNGSGRSSYGSGNYRGSHRGGAGSSSSSSSAGAYGYGGNYRSGGAYFGGAAGNGTAAGYGYGRGYGYGVGAGYGAGYGAAGYGSAYGGSIYGNPYSAYGAYSAMYGAQGGYGSGFGSSYGGGEGGGGGGGSGGSSRAYGRYHPYGK